MKIHTYFTVALILLIAFATRAASAQTAPKVDVSAAPRAFNPGMAGTVISYGLYGFDKPDVMIKVLDKNGVAIRTVDPGIVSNGQYSLAWDGKDNRGVIVPQGDYTVNVSVLAYVPAVPQYLFKMSVPAMAGKPGTFYYPYCVATDGKDDVYVTDVYHHCVQKFDRDGNFLLKWGSYGSGSGQFKCPAGIAVDRSGNVYVVDTGNNRVQKFDANGSYIARWGGSGTGSGKLSAPYGIVFDGKGSLFVADTGNCRVQRFTTDGVFQGAWGSPGTGNGQFQSPYGIAVAPDGRVYVTDSKAMRVQIFSAAGVYLARWGTYGSGNGQLNTPYGITIDDAGHVYVADGRNDRVQVFETDGHYMGKWGQTGSGNGQLRMPVGVACMSDGCIVVVDCWNHRFEAFKPDTSSGTGRTTTFTAQAGVIVDSTPPSITLTTPADRACYSLNQKVRAGWNAADSLAGVGSASGTVASGAYIDTSKAGSYTFTVQATDDAGNAANLESKYAVAGSAGTSGPAVQFIGGGGTGPVFNVELARTSAEINRGLMFRTSLAEDAGMLFIFSGDYNHYFWMANTYIPLDMVYISSHNTVVGIRANAVPLSVKRITPPAPCHYVLEINGGRCAQKGIRVGDKVKISGV